MPSLANSAVSWLVLLRRLPGYLPFAPLIVRSFHRRGGDLATLPYPSPLPGGEGTGSLTLAEREWLTLLVSRTPEQAVILQTSQPEVDVTCALAAGCWASQRHVEAFWPETSLGSAAFREWHRAVVRNRLAPYVRPRVEGALCETPIDMLFVGNSESWPDGTAHAAIVVRRWAGGDSGSATGATSVCGRLAAYYPAPAQRGSGATARA
jgi:hypothetical protein